MNGSSSIAEKVAIAVTTLAMVVSVAFAVVIGVAYNNNSHRTATTAGTVVSAADGSGNPVVDASATPDSLGTAIPVGGGGTTTTTSNGGGSGSAATSHLSNSQAASGVTADRITVGGIFDMTGAVDSSVERDTVRAYFDKVNAAGGVNGRKLQMVDCDSRYDVTAAQQCSNQMISSNVLAIVGWTLPKGEDEQVSRLTQANIPIIGGLGTPAEFASPLSFPVSTPFTRYGQGLAARAKELGIKHPAIVYISDVGWVAPVKDALLKALHDQGIHETHVAAATSTEAAYDQDVSALEHQNDAGPCATSDSSQPCPDGLIPALDPFSYNRLFQAMRRANWHPTLLGGGLDKGSSQSDYKEYLDGANSLVPFLSPYDNPNNPTVKDYLGTMQTYYPGKQYNALDIYTQHSWTAAMVFVEALKRAGTNVTRASLVQALNSIQNFDTGWSKPLSYGSGNHDPNHCFTWTKHDPNPSDAGGTWHTISDWKCFN